MRYRSFGDQTTLWETCVGATAPVSFTSHCSMADLKRRLRQKRGRSGTVTKEMQAVKKVVPVFRRREQGGESLYEGRCVIFRIQHLVPGLSRRDGARALVNPPPRQTALPGASRNAISRKIVQLCLPYDLLEACFRTEHIPPWGHYYVHQRAVNTQLRAASNAKCHLSTGAAGHTLVVTSFSPAASPDMSGRRERDLPNAAHARCGEADVPPRPHFLKRLMKWKCSVNELLWREQIYPASRLISTH